MDRALLILTLCALGPLVGPAVAGASESEEEPPVDEPEADTGDAQRAQEFFDRGAELYYQQEYGRAIVEFRRAQEAYSHPLFLYNIALSSLRIDNYEQALNAAREAEEMEASLPPENSARNRSIIASVETVYRTRDVAEAVDERVVADEELEDVEQPPEPEDVDESSRLSALSWAGLTGLGLGVASLGGAGLMEMQVQSSWDDVQAEMATMDDQRFDAEINSIERRQTIGRAMLFGGMGLVAAGGTLMGIDLVVGGDEGDDGIAVQSSVRGLDVSVRW